MVVNVAFLLKVYIHHCYPGVIGICKNSNIKAKILKTEGLVKIKLNIYRRPLAHHLDHRQGYYAVLLRTPEATILEPVVVLSDNQILIEDNNYKLVI